MSTTPQSQTAPFPTWRFVFSVIWLVGLTTVGLVLTGYWHAGSFDHLELLELAQDDEWQVFEPDDYGCTVELPGAVYDVVLNPPSQDFPSQFATRSARPFESFGISAQKHRRYKTWGKAQVATVLREVFEPFEKQFPGLKMQSEESLMFDDYPALQRTYTIPKYQNVVGRVVLIGDRSFLLIAAGKRVSATNPRVTRFLESLIINDPDVLESAQRFAVQYNPALDLKAAPNITAEPSRELLPAPRLVRKSAAPRELLPKPRVVRRPDPTHELLPAPRLARGADPQNELLPEPRLAFDSTPPNELLPAPRLTRKTLPDTETESDAK